MATKSRSLTGKTFLSSLFQLTCFLCCLPFLSLLAETPDPTLAEYFTALQLKLPHHAVEKVFLANDNQANFTSFQGIADIEVVDGCLRFRLTGKHAVLGWGNYQAKQAVSDIVGLWEQRNDVEFRLRQSGNETTWAMIPWADGECMFRLQALPAMLQRTLKGTNWSNLTFYDRAVRVPVPDGYEFIINGQSGDIIEIEQLRVFQPVEQGVCRYEFELPTNKIWRAAAMVAAGSPDGVYYPDAYRRSLLFVNGTEVPRRGPVYFQHAAALDLTPYLQSGNNCIGFEYYAIPPNGATVYLQMKVVFDSGETLCLQTDETWKVHDGIPSTSAWNKPGYDDTAWALAETQNYNFRKRSYFDQSILLPEHDGLLVISHPSGKQLYYTDQEDVLLDIAIPPGLAARQPTVLCEFGRAGNDGLSMPFGNSVLTNWTAAADSLTSQISLGRLDGGVYTVALTLKCGDEIIEQRPREPLMVIRKLNQKIVQGTNYMDGLDLELEDTIDFTAVGHERPWIEWKAHYGKNNTEIEQPNIIREAGLHYREGTANAGSGFSYRLNPFKHVGDFYLMELEYPDDAERDFVAVIA